MPILCLILAAAARAAAATTEASSPMDRSLNTPRVSTDREKAYVLFKVPPFEVTYTFPDPGFYNWRGQTALMDIDESIDAITSRYLYDFCDQYIDDLARKDGIHHLGQKLYSLEVLATLYEVDKIGNIVAGPNLEGRRLLVEQRGRGGRFLRTSTDGGMGPRRSLTSFIPGSITTPTTTTSAISDRYIVAEFTGTAVFEDYRYEPGEFDYTLSPKDSASESGGAWVEDEDEVRNQNGSENISNTEDEFRPVDSEDEYLLLDEVAFRSIIEEAFLQTKEYLLEVRNATDDMVASVMDIKVRYNLDASLPKEVEAAIGSQTASSPASPGTGIGIPTSSITTTGEVSGGFGSGAPSQQGDSGIFDDVAQNGMSKREAGSIAAMSLFLVAFIAISAMYVKRQVGKIFTARGGETGGAGSASATLLFLRSLTSSGNEAVESDLSGTESFLAEVGRKHSQGGNPLIKEGVYGASFRLSDREQVLSKYDQSSKSRKRKSKPLITPMMMIVEEEAPPPPPQRYGELPSPKVTAAADDFQDEISFVKSDWSSSSKLTKDMPGVLGGIRDSVVGSSALTSPTGVENFNGVYRDFPRENTPPRLMFSEDGARWQTSMEERDLFEPNSLNAISLHIGDSNPTKHATQDQAETRPESLVADVDVDGFVDKLEKLVDMKTRQFVERTQMEKERARRRKEREENKRTDKKELSPGLAYSSAQIMDGAAANVESTSIAFGRDRR